MLYDGYVHIMQTKFWSSIKNNTFHVYLSTENTLNFFLGMAECVCLSEITFYRAIVYTVFESRSFQKMMDFESNIARSGKESGRKESAGDETGNENQCVKLITVL